MLILIILLIVDDNITINSIDNIRENYIDNNNNKILEKY